MEASPARPFLPVLQATPVSPFVLCLQLGPQADGCAPPSVTLFPDKTQLFSPVVCLNVLTRQTNLCNVSRRLPRCFALCNCVDGRTRTSACMVEPPPPRPLLQYRFTKQVPISPFSSTSNLVPELTACDRCLPDKPRASPVVCLDVLRTSGRTDAHECAQGGALSCAPPRTGGRSW